MSQLKSECFTHENMIVNLRGNDFVAIYYYILSKLKKLYLQISSSIIWQKCYLILFGGIQIPLYARYFLKHRPINSFSRPPTSNSDKSVGQRLTFKTFEMKCSIFYSVDLSILFNRSTYINCLVNHTSINRLQHLNIFELCFLLR